eukprot:5357126-Alexandrium_andersonii.AAC.1
MKITHSSAVARVRPHAVAWANNLKNKLKETSETADVLVADFNTKSALLSDVQLSKKERVAVMTLAFHTSDKFLESLTAYLQKRSIKNCAVSLEALQSPAIVLGFSPKKAKSTKWKDILATTMSSLDLVVARWIADFEDLPKIVRRKRTEDELTALILNTNLLTWAMDKCRVA